MVSTYKSRRHHRNKYNTLLPDHLPKVDNSVLERCLRCDVVQMSPADINLRTQGNRNGKRITSSDGNTRAKLPRQAEAKKAQYHGTIILYNRMIMTKVVALSYSRCQHIQTESRGQCRRLTLFHMLQNQSVHQEATHWVAQPTLLQQMPSSDSMAKVLS